MPDVTPALAVLGGSGWDIQKPTPYVGGSQASGYTWANKPAANAVPSGTVILITDFGVAPGLFVITDGVRWMPFGTQCLARSSVAASITGTLAETQLGAVTIPAGLMGLSGGIEVRTVWTMTNSANNKIMRTRLGGIGGTAYLSRTETASVILSDVRRIRNRGAANSQLCSFPSVSTGGVGSTSSAVTTGANDTTAAQDLVFTGTLALVGETIALESYEVFALP